MKLGWALSARKGSRDRWRVERVKEGCGQNVLYACVTLSQNTEKAKYVIGIEK